MPKRTKIDGPATQEEISEALKIHNKAHQQRRLLAIVMATLGIFTREQIAQALSQGRATIGRWIKTYQHGGIDALLKRNYQGRKPTLCREDADALKQVLQKGRFKTAKEIQQWLAKERGVELKLSGVYYWLNKLTGRHKVPRKVHDKQDPRQKVTIIYYRASARVFFGLSATSQSLRGTFCLKLLPPSTARPPVPPPYATP